MYISLVPTPLSGSQIWALLVSFSEFLSISSRCIAEMEIRDENDRVTNIYACQLPGI
jgi:hypothetical protein